MKKIYTLLTIVSICLMTTFSNAQEKLQVSESSESIGGGSNNALTVTIYQVNKKEVEKEWKDLMKKMKAKVSIKKEIFADDAQHKKMGDNTFDVYARVEETGENEVKLIAAFDLGGAFMSSGQHPEKFAFVKQIVYDFAVDMTKKAIEKEVKEEEKTLVKMEKEQEDLVKSKEQLHSDIEEYKQKIEQAEKDIEQNEKDQETKKTEIDEQKKVVEEVKKKLDSVK